MANWTSASLLLLLHCILYTALGEVVLPAGVTSSCRSLYGYEEGLDPRRSFSSPPYRKPYLPNQDCIRVINATHGFDILLHFQHYFQIEKSYEHMDERERERTPHCPNDFIEFRDGPYGFSPLIGRYCGMVMPAEDIRARSGFLWIRFHSDDILEYKGFLARYHFERAAEVRPRPQECHFDITGELDGFIDTRTALSAQENVTGSSECVWRVEVSESLHLALYLHHFALGQPNQCASNFLEIYADSTFERPLRRFCGLTATHVFSSRSVLFVRIFTLDAAIRSRTSIRALFTAYARHKNCSLHGLHSCGDENCIPLELVCNGRHDCLYHSDEENCQQRGDRIWAWLLSSYSPLVLLILIVFVIVSVLVMWSCDLCGSSSSIRKYSSYLTELSSRPPPGIVVHSALSALGAPH